MSEGAQERQYVLSPWTKQYQANRKAAREGHVAALVKMIDAAIEARQPLRFGAIKALLAKRGVVYSMHIGSCFKQLHGTTPTGYYLRRLVDAARVERIANPAIKRGPLAAKIGANEAMIDKVLAQLNEHAKEAA